MTDLSPVGKKHELRARVFGGEHIAKDVQSRVVHKLSGDKGKRPSTIRLRKLQTADPRFIGVESARLDLSQPGMHEIHIVVEGQVPVENEAKIATDELTTIFVPFRRERVIRWFVPSKM